MLHTKMIAKVTVFLWLSLLATVIKANATEDHIIENEYIVVFKKSSGQTPLRGLDNAEMILSEGKIGNKAFFRLKLTNEEYELLRADPTVEQLEPNRRVSVIKPVNAKHKSTRFVARQKNENPSEACNRFQLTNNEELIWGLIRTSHIELPDYLTDPYMFDYDGLGVDAYVLDTGIDIDHQDFMQTIGRAAHEFVASDIVSEGNLDLHGHGTNVASLLAGDIFGMASLANLYSVKVLDGDGFGSYVGIIEGLSHVTNKIRAEKTNGKKPKVIINMSLGGQNYSQIMYDAIQDAIDEGIIVIVAAGNDGEEANLHFPGAFVNTITVGASDMNDNFADFSNYGPEVDITAPGVEVIAAVSTYSDFCSTATPYQCLASASGTSQACPHVAGAVARYLESLADEELPGQEGVRSMLHYTASTGFVKYQTIDQGTTPNRLLYKNCGITPPIPTSSLATKTTTTTTTNTGGAQRLSLPCMGALTLICMLITLLNQCQNFSSGF